MTAAAPLPWRSIESLAAKYGWHVDRCASEALLLTGTRPRDFWAPELAAYDHDVVEGCVVVRVPLRGWCEQQPVAREVRTLRAHGMRDPRSIDETDEITAVITGWPL